MTIYMIGSLFTAGILLNAFLRDETASKTDVYSWLTLLCGMLLWAIVLPLAVRKKIMLASSHQQAAMEVSFGSQS